MVDQVAKVLRASIDYANARVGNPPASLKEREAMINQLSGAINLIDAFLDECEEHNTPKAEVLKEVRDKLKRDKAKVIMRFDENRYEAAMVVFSAVFAWALERLTPFFRRRAF